MATQRINLTHQFLIAMPGMADDSFAGAVIYLCEHNSQGALGLMINRPTDLRLGQLFERIEIPLQCRDLAGQTIFYGGPVQSERGFVLHDAPPQGEAGFISTLAIAGGGLAMTTSKDVLEAVSRGQGPRRMLIALGYSGWAAGQLEDEIGHNGWLTVGAEPEVIFNTPVAQRYARALGLLGVDPRMLSAEAGHA